MQEPLPRLSDMPRRGPISKVRTGRPPLQYDRHGDIVVDELEDDCGANVVPSRWLAQPFARRA